MNTSMIISIGRRLTKSKGYYEWCKKHNLDPNTAKRLSPKDLYRNALSE